MSDAGMLKHITMKKIIILTIVSVLFTSCSIITKTATSKLVKTEIITSVMADLEVSSEKINYYYVPTTAVYRAGVKNTLNNAIREALLANGDADLLVGMEYEVKYVSFLLFFRTVDHIVVSGYPAKYKNFRTPSDSETIKLHISGKNGASQKTSLFFNQ